MPIQNELAHARSLVDQNLGKYLILPGGQERRLAESMRYSAIGGGKAFRAFLVLEVAKMFHLSQQTALQIATALEMVHSYSLIHDDLPAMDNDTLRRGKPTNHLAFDEATAILAGDSLLTLAFQVLSDVQTHPDAEIRSELVHLLAQRAGFQGMAGGQMLDLIAEKEHFSLSEIERLQSLKTGCLLNYAVIAPAIAAQATIEQKEALNQYAYAIGLMFQMTDDLLDIESTSDQMGKTVGKDQSAQKSTFISLLGVEATRQKVKELEQVALHALQIFGPTALLLEEAARFITTRKM